MTTKNLTTRDLSRIMELIHDLNNLMAALYGSIRINLKGEKDQERRKQLQFLEKLAKDGINLLQEARLGVRKSPLPKKTKLDVKKSSPIRLK